MRAGVVALLVAGLAGLVQAPAAAQAENGTASLQGVVFDSTAMSELSGARVAIFGTNASADTDQSGRFRLTSVPAGDYWVSFFHPRLQELGVSPPSRQVTLRAGQTSTVQLAVPSEHTLLLGWCMAEQPGPGYAVVAGVVVDSITGVPMPRAIVTATPVNTMPGAPRPVEVRTDDVGSYRMCAAPAGTPITVQAHFGRSSGRSVQMTLLPGTVMDQDLVLLMSSEGTLAGYVRDYVTGEPVPGATVSVLGTTSATLTDGRGKFVMDDIPPGRHLITTDHLAFEERTDSVTIFSEETVDIEVRLATEALEVEGLVVTARTRFGRTSLAGDDKRADYLSREEIELMLPRIREPMELLRNMNVPGFRVREVNQADPLTGAMTRGICVEVSRRSGGEGCAMAAVFVNGIRMPYPDQFLREMDPNAIDRIEILSPVDAVFQHGTQAGNGAVLIFTR